MFMIFYIKIRVLKLRILAFSRGYGGFRELREAGRKHFHLSWYPLVPGVMSYDQKSWVLGEFFATVYGRFMRKAYATSPQSCCQYDNRSTINFLQYQYNTNIYIIWQAPRFPRHVLLLLIEKVSSSFSLKVDQKSRCGEM